MKFMRACKSFVFDQTFAQKDILILYEYALSTHF